MLRHHTDRFGQKVGCKCLLNILVDLDLTFKPAFSPKSIVVVVLVDPSFSSRSSWAVCTYIAMRSKPKSHLRYELSMLEWLQEGWSVEEGVLGYVCGFVRPVQGSSRSRVLVPKLMLYFGFLAC